jgi:hypothetical protein
VTIVKSTVGNWKLMGGRGNIVSAEFVDQAPCVEKRVEGLKGLMV